jgi:hypothetical protein
LKTRAEDDVDVDSYCGTKEDVQQASTEVSGKAGKLWRMKVMMKERMEPEDLS